MNATRHRTKPTKNIINASGHEAMVVGQILKSPGLLDQLDLLDMDDFTVPEYRAWVKAARAIAKNRGTLTTDDVPALIEAVAEITAQPLGAVHAQAVELVEKTFSTANIRDDAVRLKRRAVERQIDAALDAKDGRRVCDLHKRLDALDEIKAGTATSKDRFNAAALFDAEFPEPEWLLQDVLPETGLYLLCGKPKAGKSWMALGIAMALAQGGFFLGRSTAKRRVMYLAMEDTPRRLNGRLKKLHLGKAAALAGLEFATRAAKIGDGLESQIRAAARDGFQVIIIDTLQKVRRPNGRNGNAYAEDYAAVSALKEIADDLGLCVLVIHHVRKIESDDPHDDVSGTNGIAGAADGSLVLRRVRGKPEAVLYVTGRDLPDTELGVRFNDGLWQFAGSAADVRTTSEQQEIIDALRPFGPDGATVTQLADATGRKGGILRHHLRRMNEAGLVRVCNTKPAPHYAIPIDSLDETINTINTIDTIDSVDTIDSAQERDATVNAVNEQYGTIDSQKARLVSGLTASPVNGVNGVNRNNGNNGNNGSPKTALAAGLADSPVNGVNGVNQNGEIWFDGQPAADPAPDMPALLAAEVGIRLDRLLAGRLTDAEWPTLITAHTRLAARLPAHAQAGLRALVAQIDTMAGRAVTTP